MWIFFSSFPLPSPLSRNKWSLEKKNQKKRATMCDTHHPQPGGDRPSNSNWRFLLDTSHFSPGPHTTLGKAEGMAGTSLSCEAKLGKTGWEMGHRLPSHHLPYCWVSPGCIPVPGPVMGRRAVKGLHSCQQPLAWWHGGWKANVFRVQRLVLMIF